MKLVGSIAVTCSYKITKALAQSVYCSYVFNMFSFQNEVNGSSWFLSCETVGPKLGTKLFLVTKEPK